MKINLEVQIKPFYVPRSVTVMTDEEDSEIPLSNLSSHDLMRLCDEFTDSVFTVAGKQKPPKIMAR